MTFPPITIPSVLLIVILIISLSPSPCHAYDDGQTPAVSTNPIGSPFYRHLAQEFNLDMHEVVKFERKGFGRGETVTIVLISSATGKPLSEYGKRRMRERVSLRTLAAEANLNYDALHARASAIKVQIEAKGDRELPPPVFEPKAKPPEGEEGFKKKEKGKEKN